MASKKSNRLRAKKAWETRRRNAAGLAGGGQGTRLTTGDVDNSAKADSAAFNSTLKGDTLHPQRFPDQFKPEVGAGEAAAAMAVGAQATINHPALSEDLSFNLGSAVKHLWLSNEYDGYRTDVGATAAAIAELDTAIVYINNERLRLLRQDAQERVEALR